MIKRSEWRWAPGFILAALCVWLLCFIPFCAGSRALNMFYRPVGAPPNWTLMFVLFLMNAALGLSALAAFNLRGASALRLRPSRIGLGIGAASGKKAAAALYVAIAVGVFLWSVLFFGIHSFLPALIWSLAMTALSLAAIRLLASISIPAGLLAAPWAAWYLYAAYLCYGFWALNI